MFRLHGTIGEFDLLRVLARTHGSAGMVCLGVHKPTGERAAVKMIARRATDGSTDAAIAAEREGAMLQGRLACLTDVVPRVYDCGEAEGVFYIAMEYVEGDDLDKRIGNGLTLPPSSAARIVADVCDCLAVAHAAHHIVHGARQSIVHGDITPSNIRVTPSGRAKLLDFGGAKAIPPAQRCAFSPYLTVQYASPERIQSGTIDVHADLWALGVVLYEALAGRRPWERLVGNASELPSRSRSYTLPVTCPPLLAQIATRATAPKLSDRYLDANALLAELEQFLFALRSHEDHLTYSFAIEPGSGELQ